jgi:hypothetical protein
VKEHQEIGGDRIGEAACLCNSEETAGLVVISGAAEKKAMKTLNYLEEITVAAINWAAG